MNLIQATNSPISLRLAGHKYKVRPLTFRELAPISVWIEEHVPSPYARAAQALTQLRSGGKAPDSATEELLLDHAASQSLAWPPKAGTKAWFDALDGADGGLVELVYMILVQTNPTLDRPKVQEIVDKLTVEDLLALIYLGVLGISPKKVEDAEEPELIQEPEPVLAASTPRGPDWGRWRE